MEIVAKKVDSARIDKILRAQQVKSIELRGEPLPTGKNELISFMIGFLPIVRKFS